ncbi:hypothetical protein WA026_006157 [Henosepilachna vigintioctopunctata]|uniref:MoaB/Mog domain-containing protein n=1 Tax=Henosepilachna vigintioctopunctata TaxID=420089 RepID=A0AAW1TNS8_9CUCU
MDGFITFGVLTVSDSCHDGSKQDVAGPTLCQEIELTFPKSKIIFQEIVPDEQKQIEETLLSWCLDGCNVILTTGGTGCSPRDITPEATKAVIEKELPGMSQFMLSKSFAITDKAMLSRPVCGVRKKTLIINLPGSTKGSKECFSFVVSAIPHAVALINDDFARILAAHGHIQGDRSVYVEPSTVVVDATAARNRHSPYPMKEVDDAVRIILHECSPTVETETIRIENALNRVLAEDVYAKDPLPPFRSSVKDGYAVRSKAGSGVRKIKASAAAGDEPIKINVGYDEAVRVSTGAPIPESADAVVQIEDTQVVEATQDGNEEIQINLLVTPHVGQDIRAIGSDIAANSKVLNKLDVISAGHIGVLAAIGQHKVKVFRRSSVGVLSTGSELKSHYDLLGPGQIRDSNKLALINLLKQYSYDAFDYGIAKDDPNSVKNALTKALASNDIVITTGGVSMGEYDLVKKVLVSDFGALLHFGRVNMRPGKPTTFATLHFRNKRKLVFGLPGNPASACVTALLFVIPCLKYIERRQTYNFPIVKATLNDPVKNNDERPTYLRAEVKYIDGAFVATTTGNQTSSRINSLVGANGLVLIPGNYKNYSQYESFNTILIGDLTN